MFKGNPALFWRRGAALEEWLSLAHGIRNDAFCIYIASVIFEPTSGLEPTWLAGFMLDFSDAKHNSYKPWTIWCYVFRWVSKNSTSKLMVDPFRMDDLTLLFRDKNPKRLHVTFLSLSNGQKLVQTWLVRIENMKNVVPFAVSKRYPFPRSGTMPLCERRVVINKEPICVEDHVLWVARAPCSYDMVASP